MYFVQMPLKVEKVSADHHEGGCNVGFMWFLSICPLLWLNIGIKIIYRWASYGTVSSLCHSYAENTEIPMGKFCLCPGFVLFIFSTCLEVNE